MVQVRSCSRESTALTAVEITIIEGCLPRQEIWQAIVNLHNHFVYTSQHLMINDCEIEITKLSAGKEQVFGGLIIPSTHCFFYRSNCRMYVVLHITREILCVDNSGYVRGEIVADFCLQKLQQLWKQGKTRHLVTVMLFMR